MKRIALFLIAMAMHCAQAQTTFGGKIGLQNYYGDANDASSFSFPLKTSSPSFGVIFEKNLGGFFIPQLDATFGILSGSKEYLDVTMNGKLADLSLKLHLDIAGLIHKESRLQVAPFVGAGFVTYNSEVIRSSTGAVIDAGHVNNDPAWGRSYALATGGRIAYEMKNNFMLFGAMDVYTYFTDAIDDYRGMSSASGFAGRDWVSRFNLGLAYTLKTKSTISDIEATPLIAETENSTNLDGVFKFEGNPKSGVKLNVYNLNNELIASKVTDFSGEFHFTNLQKDEPYYMTVDDGDKALFKDGEIYFQNNDGLLVKAAEKGAAYTYTFTALGADELNELNELVVDDKSNSIKGLYLFQELPKEGVMLYLMDDNDNIIDSVMTNADGSFTFSKLKPNGEYNIRLADEADGVFAGSEIQFLNSDGTPVMIGSTGNKSFGFTAFDAEEMDTFMELSPEYSGLLYRKIETKNGKATASSEAIANGGDTLFKNEIIYFNHNSFWINQNQKGTKGAIIAEKLNAKPDMRILIEGWASKVGEERYNITLSQRRADALKELLVTKYGIASDRIEAKGMGEVKGDESELESRRARIYIIY